MKRDIFEDEQTLDLVSCLMLLSKDGQNDASPIKKHKTSDRAFVCKTCNREFSSFQALGGHRASHNKPRLIAGNGTSDLLQLAQSSPNLPAKPKTHECPICGVEFAIGQALGGHMRRHRDVMTSAATDRGQAAAVPVLKKSNSSKRVSCLNLELNLAPPGYQRHYDLTKLQLIA
ncbi:zinc finger protein ZAT12-like [Argentina anserina]|uniref:zinc finger protein ZAT12-like n=1 Tax=Argentina anserina TaxID=57926 RepID=UPI0021764FCE|nr:zinc finger protein ZAT12-like [Potentilla anserina]